MDVDPPVTRSITFEAGELRMGLGEERFITFGVSSHGRLLVVAHTDREDIIRIISARQATSTERKIYEEG